MTAGAKIIMMLFFGFFLHHYFFKRKIIAETFFFLAFVGAGMGLILKEFARLETRLLMIAAGFLLFHLAVKIRPGRFREKEEEKSYAEIKEWVETIFSSLFIALFIMHFFLQAFKIPSRSMVPTFLVQDHLFAVKFSFGIRNPLRQGFIKTFRRPGRGEIVIFRYPLDTKKDFVKRAIGLPGEKVQIRDKKIFINDRRLEEPYVQFTDETTYPQGMSSRDNFGPVLIPPGHYFVLGDNRDESLDSRFWGPLEEKYLVGKPGLIYWPPKRIRIVKSYYGYDMRQDTLSGEEASVSDNQ
ncbi:MAG TPA: signal peptidase I [bacterium]|nr:signal peptidase I [bacterium]